MINRKSLLLFLLMGSVSMPAYADIEFYGIQMRDERVASSLVLGESVLGANDLSQGPLFNKSVYATASLKEDADQRVNFSVTIFNNSDKVIEADYQYRDYYLVTKDGRKYPLYDPETQFDIDEIQPKANVKLQPSLGNLVLPKKNIKMVVCSFDLGRTTLVLFPSSKKETIEKLVPPPVPVQPVTEKPKNRGLFLTEIFKGNKGKPSADKAATGTLVNTETQQAFDLPADQPTATTQAAVQPAQNNSRVDEAIKKFVYVPASGLENAATAVVQAPASLVEPSGNRPSAKAPAQKSAPRADAQVLQYNPSYKFITLNAGIRDGLKKNMLIYIMRDGRTVAQARVKQIRDAVSAASVIPDSVISEVRAGDKISLA